MKGINRHRKTANIQMDCANSAKYVSSIAKPKFTQSSKTVGTKSKRPIQIRSNNTRSHLATSLEPSHILNNFDFPFTDRPLTTTFKAKKVHDNIEEHPSRHTFFRSMSANLETEDIPKPRIHRLKTTKPPPAICRKWEQPHTVKEEDRYAIVLVKKPHNHETLHAYARSRASCPQYIHSKRRKPLLLTCGQIPRVNWPRSHPRTGGRNTNSHPVQRSVIKKDNILHPKRNTVQLDINKPNAQVKDSLVTARIPQQTEQKDVRNTPNIGIRRPRQISNLNIEGYSDAIIDRHRRLLIAFTPRACCTLIVSMMIHHLGLYNEAKGFDKWIHRFRENKLKTSTDYTPNIGDWQNKGICKIKVVRNPYYRAVSSYTHYVRTTDTNLSFEEYLTCLLNNSTDGQSQSVVKMRNYHCRLQSSSLDKYIDYFIRIENLESGEEKNQGRWSNLLKIDKKLGTTLFDSYLAVKMSDSHIIPKDSKIDFYIGNRRADFFRQPGNKYRIPDYPSFYNDITKKKVEQLYQKDIDDYEYPYPF